MDFGDCMMQGPWARNEEVRRRGVVCPETQGMRNGKLVRGRSWNGLFWLVEVGWVDFCSDTRNERFLTA